MKKSFVVLITGLVLADHGHANAMTSTGYAILGESFSLVLLLACLIIASLIITELRGGKFGQPWIFMAAGFAVALAASVIHLLDLKAIIFGDYDLRPIYLAARTASMLLILVGLFFYKKGLQ